MKNRKRIIKNKTIKRIVAGLQDNYYVVPIPLCKLPTQVNGKHFKFYCKNKGLIYAVAQIGIYRGANVKKSAYKRGVDFICQAYYQQYNQILFKSEVKRLLRPNMKRKHCLKVPNKTIEILNCIANHVDHPSDGKPHVCCREMRLFFCKKNNRNIGFCYHYLVNDLLDQLRAVAGGLTPATTAAVIYQTLDNHQSRCV